MRWEKILALLLWLAARSCLTFSISHPYPVSVASNLSPACRKHRAGTGWQEADDRIRARRNLKRLIFRIQYSHMKSNQNKIKIQVKNIPAEAIK